MDDVFVDLQIVGHLDQRRELGAELVLGGGHFVMVLFRFDAHLAHERQHLGADVLAGIDRRNREVAALDGGTVAQIGMFEAVAAIVGAGIVGAFLGVEGIEALVHRDVETHVVENEEFGFGTEKGGVAEAGAGEILLGRLGNGARIATVGLTGQRLDDIAGDGQRRLGEKRIDHGAAEIGHQHHVGFVDRLPAGDRGAVEHRTVGQKVFVNRGQIEGDVLPLSARVGEAQIDVLDFLFFDE